MKQIGDRERKRENERNVLQLFLANYFLMQFFFHSLSLIFSYFYFILFLAHDHRRLAFKLLRKIVTCSLCLCMIQLTELLLASKKKRREENY